jgi:hypothetical protein
MFCKDVEPAAIDGAKVGTRFSVPELIGHVDGLPPWPAPCTYVDFHVLQIMLSGISRRSSNDLQDTTSSLPRSYRFIRSKPPSQPWPVSL